MATGRITKRSVEGVQIPETGKRAYLWDETLKGFGVMVTSNASRSYLVQYRIGGRVAPTRRYTIGQHGSPWTADKARERAEEVLESVRRKVDPVDADRAAVAASVAHKERSTAEREIAERLGFSVFADRFIEKYAKFEQPKSWRETQGVFARDLKPAFKDTPLPEITDADIVEALENIGERSASAARKAYSALSVMFGYAHDKERRHMPRPARPCWVLSRPRKLVSANAP